MARLSPLRPSCLHAQTMPRGEAHCPVDLVFLAGLVQGGLPKHCVAFRVELGRDVTFHRHDVPLVLVAAFHDIDIL